MKSKSQQLQLGSNCDSQEAFQLFPSDASTLRPNRRFHRRNRNDRTSAGFHEPGLPGSWNPAFPGELQLPGYFKSIPVLLPRRRPPQDAPAPSGRPRDKDEDRGELWVREVIKLDDAGAAPSVNAGGGVIRPPERRAGQLGSQLRSGLPGIRVGFLQPP